MEDDPKPLRHPSFAVVSLTRLLGGGENRLFGSFMEPSSVIVLQISRASITHRMGDDSISGDHETLIEVQMTDEQFGRLLSSMDMGEVPCTLSRLNMKSVEPPPPQNSLNERVYAEFEAKMEALGEGMMGDLPKLKKILTKEGAINKGDREALLRIFMSAHVMLKNNSTFSLHQFQRAAEKVVSAAKIDINTYANEISKKVGLPVPPPALTLEAKKGNDKP